MDTLNILPKRNPDIAWRAIEDEGLLVHPHQGTVYPLNPVGLRLWQESNGTKNLGQIIAQLLQEFDVPKDVLTQDVLDFVGLLQKEKMLDIQTPQPL